MQLMSFDSAASLIGTVMDWLLTQDIPRYVAIAYVWLFLTILWAACEAVKRAKGDEHAARDALAMNVTAFRGARLQVQTLRAKLYIATGFWHDGIDEALLDKYGMARSDLEPLVGLQLVDPSSYLQAAILREHADQLRSLSEGGLREMTAAATLARTAIAMESLAEELCPSEEEDDEPDDGAEEDEYLTEARELAEV